jgi:hypothetical protein
MIVEYFLITPAIRGFFVRMVSASTTLNNYGVLKKFIIALFVNDAAGRWIIKVRSTTYHMGIGLPLCRI